MASHAPHGAPNAAGPNTPKEEKKLKGGIASRIGQIIYGHTQDDKDGTLRSDKKNFIRALISSYIPGIGVLPVLWFMQEVNKLAAEHARSVTTVKMFSEDIIADRKSVEAGLINLALNPVLSFLAYREILEFFAQSDTATFLAGATALVNFVQSYFVLKLARDDHSATATSGGQKLYDTPPDQGIRSTASTH